MNKKDGHDKSLESSIIKIQRKYRTLKSEINNLNHLVLFQRDYLLSMLNNLSTMNNLKLYQESDSLFVTLINELKQVKDLIEKCPDMITYQNLHTNSISSYKLTNKKITELLIRYSNHITPENINYMLRLLVGENWVDNFSNLDLEKILFITRFIKPISVWDSEFHKFEIMFSEKLTSSESLSINRPSSVTKDIIESLLDIVPKQEIDKPKLDNLKINSIIVNSTDSTMPAFLKTINDLIEMNPKKSSGNRVNHFTETECLGILGDENIRIVKNTKSSTLIEDKIGASIYIRLPNKIIVIQGLFKDDLLNIASSIKWVRDKMYSHKSSLNYDVLTVPKYFKDNYLKILR